MLSRRANFCLGERGHSSPFPSHLSSRPFSRFSASPLPRCSLSSLRPHLSPPAHRQKQSGFPGVIKRLARCKNAITQDFFPFPPSLLHPFHSPPSMWPLLDRRLAEREATPISPRPAASSFFSFPFLGSTAGSTFSVCAFPIRASLNALLFVARRWRTRFRATHNSNVESNWSHYTAALYRRVNAIFHGG